MDFAYGPVGKPNIGPKYVVKFLMKFLFDSRPHYAYLLRTCCSLPIYRRNKGVQPVRLLDVTPYYPFKIQFIIILGFYCNTGNNCLKNLSLLSPYNASKYILIVSFRKRLQSNFLFALYDTNSHVYNSTVNTTGHEGLE